MRTFDLRSLCEEADEDMHARTVAYRMRRGRIFYAPGGPRGPYTTFQYGVGAWKVEGRDRDTNIPAPNVSGQDLLNWIHNTRGQADWQNITDAYSKRTWDPAAGAFDPSQYDEDGNRV